LSGSCFWGFGRARRRADLLAGEQRALRRSEAAIRESEARKAAIVAGSLDAIVTIDGGGAVVEFNPAAERMFGYSAVEAVGRLLGDLIVPPALRTAHRRGIQAFIAGGAGKLVGRRVEITAMRADGTEFPAELAIVPVE